MVGSGEAHAAAVRAAAAVLVLIDGSSAELSELCAVGGSQLAVLRSRLCEGDRPTRARNLSAILTAVAVDLANWGVR